MAQTFIQISVKNFIMRNSLQSMYSIIPFFADKTSTNRFSFFNAKNLLRSQSQFKKHILIVGYNATAKKFVSYVERKETTKKIVGFTENIVNVKELTHYPILSDINSTVDVSKKFVVNEIYSTVTPEENPNLSFIMKQAEHECIRFKFIKESLDQRPQSFKISHANELLIFSERRSALDYDNNRLFKRAFDLLISVFALIFIFAFLVPTVGILLVLDSKGPMFFSQLRVGRNRKFFRCYKFRSMHVNKEAHSKQAEKNDKRITNFGKFLRRTNLDEFPQFLNVFLGNMSLVGPRPHMINDTAEFSRKVGHYMIRHFVKPGITGWAQVKSYRGETTEVMQVSDRLQHDIWYLENWSLWLDIRIIFLTIVQMLRGAKNAC